MSTIEPHGVVYLFGASARHRSTIHATGPLFDANVIEWLACAAITFRRDTEGDDALRFALIIAGFQFSRSAAAA
jgi:hypothetical protein